MGNSKPRFQQLTKFSTIQEELDEGANISARPTSPHSCVLQHVRSAISSASRPSAQMQRTEKKPYNQDPQIHQGSRDRKAARPRRSNGYILKRNKKHGGSNLKDPPKATNSLKGSRSA
ncbi:hypothetical protein Nepgr_028309 [Nepenthes gracilis]|uniref:Uncharacterized protein n=1 Tax=Nepenthes gracilis TaxID=150966 RepID=A0AAD3TCV7_NEPGR|nr:hypothetical protein Nepgr_028309 [Nepenthes gracilis]